MTIYLGYLYMSRAGSWTLWVMTAIAFVFGLHMVLAIGGADMPVVVSMLNSYSGWTASAAGFMLGNENGTNSTFWEHYRTDGTFDGGAYMSNAHGWATGPAAALTFNTLGIRPGPSSN